MRRTVASVGLKQVYLIFLIILTQHKRLTNEAGVANVASRLDPDGGHLWYSRVFAKKHLLKDVFNNPEHQKRILIDVAYNDVQPPSGQESKAKKRRSRIAGPDQLPSTSFVAIDSANRREIAGDSDAQNLGRRTPNAARNPKENRRQALSNVAVGGKESESTDGVQERSLGTRMRKRNPRYAPSNVGADDDESDSDWEPDHSTAKRTRGNQRNVPSKVAKKTRRN